LLGQLRSRMAAALAVGCFEAPLPDGTFMQLPVLPFD